MLSGESLSDFPGLSPSSLRERSGLSPGSSPDGGAAPRRGAQSQIRAQRSGRLETFRIFGPWDHGAPPPRSSMSPGNKGLLHRRFGMGLDVAHL